MIMRLDISSRTRLHTSPARLITFRPLHCLPKVPDVHPLAGICIIHELQDVGTLVLRPLSSPDRPALINEAASLSAASLLTEAFVLTSASRRIDAYARFLKREIGTYISSHIKLFPKTLILGAFLSPPCSTSTSDDNQEATSFSSSDDETKDPPDLQRNPSSQSIWREECFQLVGTVEVSFEGSTRQLSWTANAPANSPYLCNMAVSPKYLRKGIGTRLISAVEVACRAMELNDLYLHLRFRDETSAGMLYQANGFVEADRDPFWVVLLGIERKKLMRKDLVPLS